MSTQADLSVIIPTLDEHSNLKRLLQDLENQQDIKLQIIVADGGSSDGTQDVAKAAQAQLIETEKGRAKQLNEGAKQAKADQLLFLHADSHLPEPFFLSQAKGFYDMKCDHLEKCAGHFRLKFERQNKDANEWAFRYSEEKTATNRFHTINGDQGMWIGKKTFQDLNRFDQSLKLMEDQAFAAKVFEFGHWVLLPGELITSGRRFESEGFHRRLTLMSIMMGLFWTGIPSFFTRARDVYVVQSEARKLQMWPFFRVIWQLMWEDLGVWNSIKGWFRVGRYVRQNSWQLFFFFDVALRKLLGPGRYPFTKFHDKVFWPLTNHVLGDALNMVLCFTWFMLILGPYFYVTEKRKFS